MMTMPTLWMDAARAATPGTGLPATVGQPAPEVRVTAQPLPQQALVWYHGPITEEGADELQQVAQTCLDYYHYDQLDLGWTSPGGSVVGMRRIMGSMQAWRRRGVRVRTQAHRMACSAAAVLLSLGDWGRRSAQPHAELLYHRVGVLTRDWQRVTEADAWRMRTQLKRLDEDMVQTLLGHALSHVGAEGLQRTVQRRTDWLRAHWADVRQRCVQAGGLIDAHAGLPAWLKRPAPRRSDKTWLAAYEHGLQGLLAADQAISPLQAWCWALIDEVEQVVHGDEALA